MQQLLSFFYNSQIYIVMGLVILVVILLIMNISTLRSLSILENKYRKFMRGVNNKNLEELVISYLDKIDEAKSETDNMKQMYNVMSEQIKGCIQKTSIVRYKAFEDVGSDLSFSIALLDENHNGVILTGIYGRNESTCYAKPIDQGLSRYDLSEEEQQVLNNAMNKRIK